MYYLSNFYARTLALAKSFSLSLDGRPVFEFGLARRLHDMRAQRRSYAFRRETSSSEKFSEASKEVKKAQERQEARADLTVENGELKRIM